MSSFTDKNIKDCDKKNTQSDTPSQSSSQMPVNNNQTKTNQESQDREIKTQHRKILHLMAEMDNLQKRYQQDLKKIKYTAIKNFALDMCLVLDNISLAIQNIQIHKTVQGQKTEEYKNINPQWDSMLQGLIFIQQNTTSILKKYHIQPINAEQNTPFNPHIHEAMQKIHHPNCAIGNVCQTIRSGYMLNDQVLRPAQVTISLGPKETTHNSV